MAKGNRTYKRDSRGRFASGGGGGGSSKGGKSKGTSTKSKNTARANELKAKGTVSLGDRIKAKGFSGGKAAQARAGGLKKRGLEAAEKMAKGGSKVSTVGRGGRAARMAAISKIRNKGRR